MNIAILTAGGTGSRMNSSIPKQFLMIYDKPIIVYTLEAFQQSPDIDAIAIAYLDGWGNILEAYAHEYKITKLKWLVPGGATGLESIQNVINRIKGEISPEDFIVVHDGNRMNVSAEILSDALQTCRKYGSAVAAIPCMEAMLLSEDKVMSNQSIPRDNLQRTQTPHVFPLKTLLWAFDEAKKRGITTSVACCTLMIELGKTVYFSKGSELNIKITTQDDILIAKALLDTRKSGRN